MMNLRAAFIGGIRQARRFGLVLPLYVCSLLLGLLQTWPLLYVGRDGLRNPFLGDLATGGGDTALNLFVGNTAALAPSAIWGTALLPLAFLFGLAYNLCSGGMLSVAARTLPFWAGCRRFFWSFTALGALLVILVLLTVGIAALVAPLVGTNITLIITLLLIQFINLIGEYGRAIAVARNRRNPFALLGAGFVFCLRHIGGVIVLAVLGLLLHALVATLAIGAQLVPLGVGAIVVQQFVVLVWMWVKLLRLTWALSYVQATNQQPTAILSFDTPVVIA